MPLLRQILPACLAAAVGAVIVLLTWGLDVAERRPLGPVAVPWTMWMVALGTAAALILSGSMLLGQLALVLAGALVSCAAVALMAPANVGTGSASFPMALL